MNNITTQIYTHQAANKEQQNQTPNYTAQLHSPKYIGNTQYNNNTQLDHKLQLNSQLFQRFILLVDSFEAI